MPQGKGHIWICEYFANILYWCGGLLKHSTYVVKIPPSSHADVNFSSPDKDQVIIGFSIPRPKIIDPRTGKPTKYALSLVTSQKLFLFSYYFPLPTWEVEMRLANTTNFYAATDITFWHVDLSRADLSRMNPYIRALLNRIPKKSHLSLIYTFSFEENGIKPCPHYGSLLCRLCSKIRWCDYKRIKELLDVANS